MSEKQHLSQLQVVDGSAVGEFHVIPKFDYNSSMQLEYMGEAKIGKPDHENAHYIQKLVYDSACNLSRILIATNRASAGCTDVSVEILSDKKVKIIANNGDFNEVEIPTQGGGAQKTGFRATTLNLKTPTQEFVGRVEEVSTNGLEVTVELNTANGLLLAETNTTINEFDLILQFNSNNKPYEKRRWTHRTRYIYATIED